MQDSRDFGLALYGGGSVLSGIGAYASGAAESKALRENANATLARIPSVQARRAVEELRIRRQASSIIGSQRASYAGQGVRLDQGTPLQAQTDVASASEEDVLTLRHNAMLEAWGLRQAARGYKYESRLSRRAGAVGALSAFTRGAAELYRYDRLGTPFPLYGSEG